MVYDDYIGCIWGPHQVSTGGSSTASPRVDNTFGPTPSSLSSRPQSSRCYCHQFSHCRMGSAACTGVCKCIAWFCISSALYLALHYELHRLYDVKVADDCQWWNKTNVIMNCYMALSWHWNQDSHVCVETRLHSGSTGNYDLVLPRDNRFLFSPNYSDRLWTPSSLSVSTSCTLLGDKLAKVATYPSAAKIKSVCVVLYLQIPLILWHGA
jgi:hypothetical protein